MFYHLSPQTSNSKLGFGVAASTSDLKTCPNSCPLKGDKGCYASAGGPLAIHWRKVSSGERGTTWDKFVDQVECLPRGWKLRLFQAGDMPSKKAGSEMIDDQAMLKLAKVVKNRNLQCWGYSHKALNKTNVKIIKDCAEMGLVINASADNLKEADVFKAKGVPTVVTVPSDFKSGTLTPKGNKVIICPQQTHGKTCAECMLCHKANRSVLVGFRVHSVKKNMLDKRLKAEMCGE